MGKKGKGKKAAKEAAEPAPGLQDMVLFYINADYNLNSQTKKRS